MCVCQILNLFTQNYFFQYFCRLAVVGEIQRLLQMSKDFFFHQDKTIDTIHRVICEFTLRSLHIFSHLLKFMIQLLYSEIQRISKKIYESFICSSSQLMKIVHYISDSKKVNFQKSSFCRFIWSIKMNVSK